MIGYRLLSSCRLISGKRSFMIHLEFEKLTENLMSDAANGPSETSVFDRLC